MAETRKGSEPPSHGAASPGGQRDSTLKIAIVDESPIRAAILEDGLREAGFTLVERIAETRNLLACVYALDPDVILIDPQTPALAIARATRPDQAVVSGPIRELPALLAAAALPGPLLVMIGRVVEGYAAPAAGLIAVEPTRSANP